MKEQERDKAEAQRVAAESERVEAEIVRQTQEGAGGEGEVSRVDAESDRADAEVGREQVALDSAEAEHEREEAALSRRDAERVRVAAEESRVEAEIGENGRTESESNRVVAEEGRVIAEEKRSDLRRFYLRITTAIALPIAFVALVPSLVGLYLLQKETDNRIDDNRAALKYMCSTTAVLDNLVSEVAKSIKLNINSGFYDQLIANGTLPPEALAQAHRNLDQYNAAHAILQDTRPCTNLD